MMATTTAEKRAARLTQKAYSKLFAGLKILYDLDAELEKAREELDSALGILRVMDRAKDDDETTE